MAISLASSKARRVALALAAGGAALLTGCVVVPNGPIEPMTADATAVYPATIYAPGPYYAAPYPYYSGYAAPYYWGPALSVGVYGRVGGGHRGHRGYWDGGGRGGWGGGARGPAPRAPAFGGSYNGGRSGGAMPGRGFGGR